MLLVLRAGPGAAAKAYLIFPIRLPSRAPRRVNRIAEGGITVDGDTRRALDVASLPVALMRQPRSLKTRASLCALGLEQSLALERAGSPSP